LGFLRTAEAMLEQALARGAPPILGVRYGSLLAGRGAYAEAVAAFQKFLATSPDDPATVAVVCSELGVALASLGDFPAAERAHRRALDAQPAYAPLYQNYADVFIKQRRWDEALKQLDAGLGHARAAQDTIGLLEAKGHVLAGQMRGEEAL